MKYKVKVKLVMVLLISLIVLLTSISCYKKPDENEIWITVQEYTKNNYKDIGNISFPPYRDEFIFEVEKNKFEVKSYITVFEVGCCGSLRKYQFSCMVEYEKGEYFLDSFKLH
jgi:hypothetical protein